MNSTPQQQKMQPPYIGSKISLISKLDIRYEGTLYTVDPIESTIALAKVHSYGTEDRRTPVFVPPRDEIYDFIIFKASDIKDLIVCEQPKASSPNSVAGLPYDPAIVSISKNPPPEPKLPHKLNMMNAIGGLTPNNVGHVGDKLGPGTRQSFEQLMAMGGPSPLRFSNYRHPTSQYQLAQQRLKNTGVPSAEGPPPVFDKDYDFEEANQQFREKIIEDQKGDIEEEEQKSVKENADTAVEENAVDENNANKQKEEHAMGDNEQQKQQAAEFYNKTLSFFDNISCDALEKAAGNVRPDWKRERQTNQETFGHNAVRNLFYQQRRGTRGYSGAGGGGAGIARYNNNYRFPSIYQQHNSGGQSQPFRYNSAGGQHQNGGGHHQQYGGGEGAGYRPFN